MLVSAAHRLPPVCLRCEADDTDDEGPLGQPGGDRLLSSNYPILLLLGIDRAPRPPAPAGTSPSWPSTRLRRPGKQQQQQPFAHSSAPMCYRHLKFASWQVYSNGNVNVINELEDMRRILKGRHVVYYKAGTSNIGSIDTAGEAPEIDLRQ